MPEPEGYSRWEVKREAVNLLGGICDQVDRGDARRLEIVRSRATPARALSQLLHAGGMVAEAEHLARQWALGPPGVTKTAPYRQDSFRPAT